MSLGIELFAFHVNGRNRGFNEEGILRRVRGSGIRSVDQTGSGESGR